MDSVFEKNTGGGNARACNYRHVAFACMLFIRRFMMQLARDHCAVFFRDDDDDDDDDHTHTANTSKIPARFSCHLQEIPCALAW